MPFRALLAVSQLVGDVQVEAAAVFGRFFTGQITAAGMMTELKNNTITLFPCQFRRQGATC
jgi:NAD/NADP transhydrogenase alpha subunit